MPNCYVGNIYINDNEKIKNIYDMLDEMRKAYKNAAEAGEANKEICLVFPRNINRASYIYEINPSRYKLTKSMDEENSRIEIKTIVDELESNYREIQHNDLLPFKFTCFHNHRNATPFGAVDILSFAFFNEMHEMFLDTNEHISYLIKNTPLNGEASRLDWKAFALLKINLAEVIYDVTKEFLWSHISQAIEIGYSAMSGEETQTLLSANDFNIKSGQRFWDKMIEKCDLNVNFGEVPKQL